MEVSQKIWTRFVQPERFDHYAVKIALTLGSVAIFWSASSTGYYALVEALGLESGYNDAPILFFFYYLLWTGLALIWFRNALSGQLTQKNAAATFRAMLPLAVACTVFVALVLPILPPVAIWRAPADPPEFMFASGWYYLPKSADILFQQVLVAAIIRTAAGLKFRIITIAIGLSIVFGGFHLLLALDGFTPTYVTRFTFAACVFGLIAPYIYLRRQDGFQWAYGLHWSFYAVDATITHFLLAVPKWMNV